MARRGKNPETAISNAVRDCLRAHGWFVVRIQQGLGCHKGISDLVAMRNGRTVWIEVKTPRGRQSDHQLAFEAAVLEAGGEYIVARDGLDVVGL